MGQSRHLFVYFRPFLITISIIQIEKSLDGVLGIRTHGRRILVTYPYKVNVILLDEISLG